MKNLICSIVLALSTTVLPTAFASPATQGLVTAEISVAQYNLVSESGANAAYTHIRQEVRKACGVSHGLTSLKVRTSQRACVSAMTDQAVTAIGAPKLTKIHTPA